MTSLAETAKAEFDAGPRDGRGTERLCVVTRKVTPVGEMIRFVVGPNGEVVADLKRKLPGRGVWVTATRAAVAEAIRRGALARGLERPVAVKAGLVDATEGLLERAALDALAIAGKAGQAVAGFGQVEAALARDAVAAVLHARDAAADGVRKIAASLQRRAQAEGREIAAIALFNSAQLSLALGRPNVVHAAVLAGAASQTFLARCARLDRFRTGEPSTKTGVTAPYHVVEGRKLNG